MDTNHLDNLDRMIDTALSCYSGATPLEGLEQRVLNRIRLAESGRQGSRWLVFGLAFATMLLMIALGLRTRPMPIAPRVPALNVATAPSQSRFRSGASEPRALATVRAARRVDAARSLPKERIFPRLAPLSSEERSLLAYARLQPIEIQGTPTSQSIEIEPIQIPPLQ